MIQAAIFDVDGTLIDSVDLHARAWQDAFAEFGHRLDFQQVRAQIGKGGDQLMPVFLSERELEQNGEQLQQRRGEIFRQRYMQQITPFPAVRDLVQRLRNDGLRIALASSAKAEELEHYKQVAQIADLLDTETSSDDAAQSKPHPDIFVAALDRLGSIDPGEVLVVGDTPYDAEAAGKAGLRSIGVLCGGWNEAELRAAGCIAIYADPASLLKCYDTSPFTGSAR